MPGPTTPLEYKPSNRYTSRFHYVVEFRARNAASYGHMYVFYGEANERHEVIRSQVAGFFPAGDKQNCENCSVYNWTIGHLVPVPSEIGASDGDLEEQYVLSRFRVWIDAYQYRRFVAYINYRKAHQGPWHAFLNNCVTFGRDAASFLNLNMPGLMSVAPSVVMYPKDVVEALREANGGEREPAPLKDAPSGAFAGVVMPKSSTDGQQPTETAAAERRAEKPVASAAAPANAAPAKKRVVASHQVEALARPAPSKMYDADPDRASRLY